MASFHFSYPIYFSDLPHSYLSLPQLVSRYLVLFSKAWAQAVYLLPPTLARSRRPLRCQSSQRRWPPSPWSFFNFLILIFSILFLFRWPPTPWSPPSGQLPMPLAVSWAPALQGCSTILLVGDGAASLSNVSSLWLSPWASGLRR